MRCVVAVMAICGCVGVASAAAQETHEPPARHDAPSVVLIDAEPERGFHYPYILRIGAGRATTTPRFLVVEPNNTGTVSDDLAVHQKAALDLSGNGVGASVARALDLPLLMPVFPRPESDWRIYTHLLDRDAMRVQTGAMRRLDLQLIAMVDDAREQLRRRDLAVQREVVLTGFSASASFVNRFTMLHPDRVRAVVAGGLNGLLMLPLERLDAVSLPYPLGLADAADIADAHVALDAWRRVPQFLFMGADDRNDAVLYDDGYDEDERVRVFGALGEALPERWARCQQLYRSAGATATFRTYPGVGHGTNDAIHQEIAGFLAPLVR